MANSLSSALAIAVRTDPGLVRGRNEDSLFTDASRGLVILADGMGGYEAGEVASQMATTLLSDGLLAALANNPAYGADREADLSFLRRSLAETIAMTNAAIYKASGQRLHGRGMGTTLVAAMFCGDHVVVAHVGDSRLYRLRAGELTSLTRDHSLLQEQIDSGLISLDQARFAAHRYLVTRAVGIDPTVEPEVNAYPMQLGDVYLLCSDGLHDMVADKEIGYILDLYQSNVDHAAAALIELANEHGGEDNTSVIVVRMLHEVPAARGAWSRLRSWFS